MDTLHGKGAVITGGASGIGLATARLLGQYGSRVVLADVEPAALSAAVDDLTRSGIEAHGVVCDVRDLSSVEELARRSFSLLDTVDIVFNNAGVAIGGPVVEMSHDDWRWVIDVNLWGPVHGVEAFLPRMIEQGSGGHVLFTSSFAGLVPNIGLGPYCVTKYGVVALAEVLARELREHDIGVSVVCPMRAATNIGASERNRPAGVRRAGRLAAGTRPGRVERAARRPRRPRGRRRASGRRRDHREPPVRAHAHRES
jgi:NAD(P)-dependent dehydrogenase (short-subunit alcohol dehydrogenase family)